MVKNASYRGLSDTKTCGLSDEYGCQLNVTCLLKKRCDGQLECNITVDDNLFPGDLSPGLTKYLYFEYQCSNLSQPYESLCICGRYKILVSSNELYIFGRRIGISSYLKTVLLATSRPLQEVRRLCL